jgi:hypothetical protein
MHKIRAMTEGGGDEIIDSRVDRNLTRYERTTETTQPDGANLVGYRLRMWTQLRAVEVGLAGAWFRFRPTGREIGPRKWRRHRQLNFSLRSLRKTSPSILILGVLIARPKVRTAYFLPLTIQRSYGASQGEAPKARSGLRGSLRD